MTRPTKTPSPPSSFFARVDHLSLPPGAIIVRDNGDRWLVGSLLNGALSGRQLWTEAEPSPRDAKSLTIGGKVWWRGELSEIGAEWLVRVEAGE